MAAAIIALVRKRKQQENARKDRLTRATRRAARDNPDETEENDGDPSSMDETGDMRALPSRRHDSQIMQLQKSHERRCGKLPFQDNVLRMYNHPIAQQLVAGLIVLNFFSTVTEKEIDPPFGEGYISVWQVLEDVFNVLFLIELLCNFYGGFPIKFWESGWNIFDFIVVCVGTLSLCRVDLPGELSLLRTLRAFRVFRLFKRIKSLNKIITSVGNAMSGVSNAFLIMLIFLCIYAIIGVEWFAEFADDGFYVSHNLHDNSTHRIESDTGRGLRYGPEYWGTFSRALYTLWQVVTGESWSEAIARPLMFGWEVPARTSGVKVAVFFVSFLVITQIIMLNVVIAVLLEKMVSNDETVNEVDEASESGDSASDGSLNNHEQPFEDIMPDEEDVARHEDVTMSDMAPHEIAALDTDPDVLKAVASLKHRVAECSEQMEKFSSMHDQMHAIENMIHQLVQAGGSTKLNI
eukprot:TRINITY_DN21921_c0_g1_i1.p1 TRINITY_DN21921_c0_g1~~TRINITY_DN21921_c0_g1_i1.p1  ORF type:complete len:464 (+),score=86.05 TRINITY_DN21921_c0_g1_i1:148-1539(+)